MNTERQNFVLLIALLGAGFLMLFAFIFVMLIGFVGVQVDFAKKDGIGVVEIIGVIEDTSDILEALHDFSTNDSIKAILVRVDSPGGAVAPSQEIYSEMMKIRGVKPLVVSMGTTAASGGYYIACAGDTIFANPGTLTGSIGVIVQTTYLRELFNFLKIKPVTYKSGKFKDTLSPFRESTKEDDALIDAVIQDIYDQFLTDVATARNMEKDEVRPVADGRLLTGRQAYENKLVDQLGNFRDAIAFAASKTDLGDDPELIYPEKKALSYLEKMFESISEGVVSGFSNKPGLKIHTRSTD